MYFVVTYHPKKNESVYGFSTQEKADGFLELVRNTIGIVSAEIITANHPAFGEAVRLHKMRLLTQQAVGGGE